MTRYVAWLKKEVREHRTLLLALLVLVPLITLAVFWVGVPPMRQFAEGIHLITLGLAALGVGAVLFGGERRHDTLDLIRRTPGAFRAAFLGKWSFYGLTLVAVVVWQALWLGVLCRVYAVPEFMADFHYEAGPDQTTWPVKDLFVFPRHYNADVVLLVGAAGIWVALASLWLRRGGANTIVGPLALLVLSIPVLWVTATHPYYFAIYSPGAPRLLAWVFGGLGLLTAIATYFGGMRFVNRTARAIRRGLVPALVLLLAGYAWTAVDLTRHLDLSPEDADFKVLARQETRHPPRAAGPYLSPNGRHLYFEAYRGVPWPARWRYDEYDVGYPHFLDGRGTRTFPWVLDLETGDARRLVSVAGRLRNACEGSHGRDDAGAWQYRTPYLVVQERWVGGPASHSLLRTWLETDTGRIGEEGDVEGPFRRPPAGLYGIACQSTQRRDASGRWTWIGQSRLRREGDEEGAPLVLDALEVQASWVQPIPDGWQAHLRGGAPPRRVTIDGETGRLRRLPDWGTDELVTIRPDAPEIVQSQAVYTLRVISPTTALVMRGEVRDGDSTTGLWHLVDLETSSSRSLQDGPEHDLTARRALVADMLFCLRDMDGTLRPELWHPAKGTFERLRYDGPALEGSGHLTLVLQDVSGHALYSMMRGFPTAPESIYLMLDAEARRCVAVTGWMGQQARPPYLPGQVGLRPIAFLPDGRLLAVEDDGTGGGLVVRLGPASGQREVVFPQRD